MDSDTKCGVAILCFIVAIVVFAITNVLQGCTTETRLHNEAVSAGVATWQANPKTGASEFVYLKCECEEQADGD